jgi:serine beta-lactamase-like protein LACTB, mitochondrial
MSDANEIFETELAPKAAGVSAAVAIDGRLIWSRQAGYAELKSKTPVAATTRFRIGSVSKPLTSAGVALLVERGRLDLDAPVQRYIADFPDKGATITPRMLAGHLSGIRNYRGLEARDSPPVPNLRAGLKVFENDALLFRPGERFSYASYNWNALGVVMEAAANQEFLSFMDENVIRPLGLNETVPDISDTNVPRRARFYETMPSGQFYPAWAVQFSDKWPSAGYLSTAEDLVRFGSALMQPGFLAQKSLRLLFTPNKTNSGKPTTYGLGWFVVKNLVFHGGDTAGGTAVLMAHPASRTVAAVVANSGQVLLRNAIARQKASTEAKKYVINKEEIAARILKALMPGKHQG